MDKGKPNLYELTGRVVRRVAEVNQRLNGIAPNSVTWNALGDDLAEAAAAAKEIAQRIRKGEVQ